MNQLCQLRFGMRLKLGLSLLAVLVLTSCGGGGNLPAISKPVLPAILPVVGSECSAGIVARIAKEDNPTVGRSTQIALVDCSNTASAISEPQWTQVAGTSLNISSARSPAISIEPAAPGLYRFSVSFFDAAQRRLSGTVDINVQAASSNALTIRGEPSVWGGGQLSLRAWLPTLSEAQIKTAKVIWSQVEGTNITLDSPNNWNLVFKAPKVASDSLLRLRATITLADGNSLTRDFQLLVQVPPNTAYQPLFSDADAATRVYPYLSQGPYAKALSECIYNPALTGDSLCLLKRLPLLGQETLGADPTIEQIMQRVLVSNDWMGANFEQFLRQQDPNGDFRSLLKATTAIVIGGRINPSFYWSATGAIYLEGEYLWLTPEQRDTLSEAPDPRSNNGSALNYQGTWRYVLNNDYANNYFPIVDRGSRTLDDVKYDFGDLLYHELTHANDTAPPRMHATMSRNLKVWQASPYDTPSQMLTDTYPFIRDPMVALQRVNSYGVVATPLQSSYTSVDIAQFFARDRVTDEYSYSQYSDSDVPAEDAAMLVEETMMQLRYGIMRDVAFTPKRLSGQSSSDRTVTWGQRGRIGEVAIRPRVKLVLGQIMPQLDLNLIDTLATPVFLKSGLTWGQNLDQNAVIAGRPRAMTSREKLKEAALAHRRLIRNRAISIQKTGSSKLH